MADCNDLFKKFYDNIKLSPSKKKNLMNSRERLRDRIRTYFKEERKESVPLFGGQGSYYMNTIVNPLEDGEYDIDDGVYLQNLDSDKLKWPTAETVHSWIYDAVKGHTSEKPIDKRTCIRVLYSREDAFHVDLPIYGLSENVAYLAEKGQTVWPESDPKAFIDWFFSMLKDKTEQLRRMVCYFKAWGDYQKGIMLNGISFTILVSNNMKTDINDDVSLINTARSMSGYLKANKSIIKPVIPNENLINEWTNDNLQAFLTKLDKLIEDGEDALKDDDKEQASLLWISQFGKRFPKYNSPDDKDAGGIGPVPIIKKEWKSKGASVLGGNPKGKI